MEGQARHRGRRRQLVHVDCRRHGREKGCGAVPRHRRHQRHVDAQGPHAAWQTSSSPAKCRWRSPSTATASTRLKNEGRADRRRRSCRRWWRCRPASRCSRTAPHPYAAVLFMDFFLSDGQRILLERGNVPTNRTVQEPPPGLIFVDVAEIPRRGRQVDEAVQGDFCRRAAVSITRWCAKRRPRFVPTRAANCESIFSRSAAF